MSGQAPDPTGAKILDAATRVLADFGFKRSTVELVAKYAGVSHMTVYRRWSSKNELLRAAAMGELRTVLDSAFTGTGEYESFDDRFIEAFVDTVWSIHRHPLMRRELDTDRDTLLAMLTVSSGTVLNLVLPQVVEHLHVLATQSHVVMTDPDALADVFVRLAHSLLLLERAEHSMNVRSDVADYARRALGPLAGAVVPAAEATPLRRRPQLHLAAAGVLVAGLLGGALLVYPVQREFTPTDSSSTSTSTSTTATTPAAAPVTPPAPLPGPSSTLTTPAPPTPAAEPAPTSTTPNAPGAVRTATPEDPGTATGDKPSRPRRPSGTSGMPPRPPTQPFRPPGPGFGAPPPVGPGMPARPGPGPGGPGSPGPP